MPRNLFGKTLSHDSGSLVPSSQTMAFNSIANLSGDTVVILELQTGIPFRLIPKKLDRPKLLTRS